MVKIPSWLLQDQHSLQTVLGLIFIPSGLVKIFLHKRLRFDDVMFPRLPSWFWVPCGVWELTGALLTCTTSNSSPLTSSSLSCIGLSLLYTFMGGVFYSIIFLKDQYGSTLVSGTSQGLGRLGQAVLLPASFTIFIMVWLDILLHTAHDYYDDGKDEEDLSTVTMEAISRSVLTYCLLGALWGEFCSGGFTTKTTRTNNIDDDKKFYR